MTFSLINHRKRAVLISILQSRSFFTMQIAFNYEGDHILYSWGLVTMRCRTLFTIVLVILVMSQLATSLPIRMLATSQDEYVDVDLAYLLANKRVFLGVNVRTKGTVRFGFSFYMFEDFWLEALLDDTLIGYLPVIVRFAGIPKPPDWSLIKVVGVMEYSDLEGGFFYLNVSQWSFRRMINQSCDLNSD